MVVFLQVKSLRFVSFRDLSLCDCDCGIFIVFVICSHLSLCLVLISVRRNMSFFYIPGLQWLLTKSMRQKGREKNLVIAITLMFYHSSMIHETLEKNNVFSPPIFCIHWLNLKLIPVITVNIHFLIFYLASDRL